MGWLAKTFKRIIGGLSDPAVSAASGGTQSSGDIQDAVEGPQHVVDTVGSIAVPALRILGFPAPDFTSSSGLVADSTKEGFASIYQKILQSNGEAVPGGSNPLDNLLGVVTNSINNATSNLELPALTVEAGDSVSDEVLPKVVVYGAILAAVVFLVKKLFS